MRSAWAILVFLIAPVSGQADDAPAESQFVPPPYRVLRFEEDYSRLSNPSNRVDWLDSIKFISWRAEEPGQYLTLGGELRERFERIDPPDFGVGGMGADSYWLQRVTLLSDLHLGNRVRVFAEGISGIIEGEIPPAPPVQDDPLDLLYAFVDVVPCLTDDESLTIRGGRFAMSLGSGRLVATRAAPNIPLRFDGGEVIYARPRWHALAFVVRPVEDKGGISGSNPDTTFWGAYITHWFDERRRQGIDLYYLGIANEHAAYASESGEESRHSFGAREFGVFDGWDYNAEQVVQVGRIGSESILAWTAALDGGYTWDALWQPRVGIKAGVTSGDHDASDRRLETFNALYFKSGYFNDAALIRPQNIIGLHPNLTLKLSPSISVDGGANWIWRYSRNDAVYAVPGAVEIPANPDAPAYVATVLDVNLQWQLQRHVWFGASYVHSLTGSYVHAAGGRGGNYVSTTLTFIF